MYLIKYRGKSVGKATMDELQVQVQRGVLSPLHKISEDGTTWKYASEFGQLFETSQSSSPQTNEDAKVGSVTTAWTSDWFVVVGEERFGPHLNSELISFVQQGRIRPGDLVWMPAFDDWRPVEDEFASAIAATQGDRRKANAVPPEEQSYSLLARASFVLVLSWPAVAVVMLLAGSSAAALLSGFVLVAASLALGLLGIYDVATSEGYRKGVAISLVGPCLGGLLLVAGIGYFLWRSLS